YNASIVVLPIVVAYEQARSSLLSLIRQRIRWFVYLSLSTPFIKKQLLIVSAWKRLGMLIHFYLYYIFPILLAIFLCTSFVSWSLLLFFIFAGLVYCLAAVAAALLLRQRIDIKSLLSLALFVILWPFIIVVPLILSISVVARMRGQNIEPEMR